MNDLQEYSNYEPGELLAIELPNIKFISFAPGEIIQVRSFGNRRAVLADNCAINKN
jgi:hypothetical protein